MQERRSPVEEEPRAGGAGREGLEDQVQVGEEMEGQHEPRYLDAREVPDSENWSEITVAAGQHSNSVPAIN